MLLSLSLLITCSCFFTSTFGKHCDLGFTSKITNETWFEDESIEFEGITYPKEKYYQKNDTGELRGCICEVSENCMRKCCAWGESFRNGKCSKSNSTLRSDLFPMSIFEGEQVVGDVVNFTLFVNDHCRFGSKRLWYYERRFLQVNGSLYLPQAGKNDAPVYLNQSWFCLDFDDDDDEGKVAVHVCNYRSRYAHKPVYESGMLISLPFLLATLLVYALVPSLQTVHGKALISYIAVLFINYVCIAIVGFYRELGLLCTVTAFMIYFLFVLSFFWMNVMCIDIWWTFSGKKGYNPSEKSERKRFLIYNLYAYGVSLLLLMTALVIQYTENIPTYILRPKLGVDKCFLPADKRLALYFYIPVIYVLVTNLMLFVHTTYSIWVTQSDISRSTKEDGQRHVRGRAQNDTNRFKLYLKLMLAFGVNWILEIIAWLQIGPHSLFICTNLMNCCYGVIIFVLFICKPSVWNMLKERFGVRDTKVHSKPAAAGAATGKIGTSATTNTQLNCRPDLKSNNSHVVLNGNEKTRF